MNNKDCQTRSLFCENPKAGFHTLARQPDPSQSGTDPGYRNTWRLNVHAGFHWPTGYQNANPGNRYIMDDRSCTPAVVTEAGTPMLTTGRNS